MAIFFKREASPSLNSPKTKLNHGNRLPSEENRKLFTEMLNNCYKYAKAINAKGRSFPTEPVIMALLFSQHKLIEWLEAQIRSL
jgi:hypothetical protein